MSTQYSTGLVIDAAFRRTCRPSAYYTSITRGRVRGLVVEAPALILVWLELV